MGKLGTGHRTGQVKWNSGEFRPHLERSGSRYAMGGVPRCTGRRCQFWLHVGLFLGWELLYCSKFFSGICWKEQKGGGSDFGSPT